MVDEIEYEDLPNRWNSFNLEKFSPNKLLWDYQQETIKNSLKGLFMYYQGFNPNEKIEENLKRKKKIFSLYESVGLEDNLNIKLTNLKREIKDLLMDHYEFKNNEISYSNFINRMSFWMATGSGKTIIIIKLIHILKKLMEYKEIPDHDILFLTYRDDLLNQFKIFIEEYNSGDNGLDIIFKDLKEYPRIKRDSRLFNKNSLIIYYYRSDNLSTEQKDKIIDFKNYENDGKWYVFLDEAHKGDKEESKRQHIYSIMARNGFLFNCSATFIDPRDIITCVYEFNLSSFINSGYGKHLTLLKQEIRAFKDNEDYTGDEKEKIVLKSLILFVYITKFYRQMQSMCIDLYHKPLLLTLVNPVNVKDADLMLFFRVLKKIGNDSINPDAFKGALNELWGELKTNPNYIFEDGKNIKIDKISLLNITFDDILKHVYNSDEKGDIEVLKRPSNNKELVFKLKSSSIPFALIKIGDISSWLKNELLGYEIQDTLFDESYFEKLNEDASHMNILMGSRSFYEGWDSNRPNVINYINIGVGKEARKFILQSVGRGIRIEPIKYMRKRLDKIKYEIKIDSKLIKKIEDKIDPIETLFIFSTNRKSLLSVIETLNIEKKNVKSKKNQEEIKKVLTQGKKTQETFEISSLEHEELIKYLEYMTDDRIFLMKYDINLKQLQEFREFIRESTNFKLIKKRKFLNSEFLIQNLINQLNLM